MNKLAKNVASRYLATEKKPKKVKYVILYKGKVTPGWSRTEAAAEKERDEVAKANNIPLSDLTIEPR